jgi:hypothetical protein
LLKDQVNIWPNFWKCTNTCTHPPALTTYDQTNNAHDLTAQLLRTASGSFKPRTSVVDGISLRQFCHISDPGLEALASILWLCEKFGTFGNTITDLAVRVLLKTD